MNSGEAADLAIFVLCCCMLAGYALLYFHFESFTLPLVRRRYVNLYAINRRSRTDWVQLLGKDPKEGINAVQTVRNQVLAVSILAAASSPLAATLIQVMTDAAKIDQVEAYSKIDPITDSPLISAPLKLGIALGVLLLAVMAFAQSVRLCVHVGYVLRVVASDPPRHAVLARQLVCIMRRSSLYFAVGLRLFFAFGPLVLYTLGPTTLLVATLLDVTAQFMFDVVPAFEFDSLAGHADDADGGRDSEQAAAAGAPAGVPPALLGG